MSVVPLLAISIALCSDTCGEALNYYGRSAGLHPETLIVGENEFVLKGKASRSGTVRLCSEGMSLIDESLRTTNYKFVRLHGWEYLIEDDDDILNFVNGHNAGFRSGEGLLSLLFSRPLPDAVDDLTAIRREATQPQLLDAPIYGTITGITTAIDVADASSGEERKRIVLTSSNTSSFFPGMRLYALPGPQQSVILRVVRVHCNCVEAVVVLALNAEPTACMCFSSLNNFGR